MRPQTEVDCRLQLLGVLAVGVIEDDVVRLFLRLAIEPFPVAHVGHPDAGVEIAGIGAQNIAPVARRLAQLPLPAAQSGATDVGLDRLDAALLHRREHRVGLGEAPRPRQGLPQSEQDLGVVRMLVPQALVGRDRLRELVLPGEHARQSQPGVVIVGRQAHRPPVVLGGGRQIGIPRLEYGRPDERVDLVGLAADRLFVERPRLLEVLAREGGVGLAHDLRHGPLGRGLGRAGAAARRHREQHAGGERRHAPDRTAAGHCAAPCAGSAARAFFRMPQDSFFSR